MVLNSSEAKDRPVLLAVVGPTATGKSALALGVAQRCNGEIVNCDSMQTIRYFDIGTAKPTPEERALVPHHLYDFVEPDEYYSAGAYMEDARRICRRIAGRGRLPVVVGGTGLYLRALLEGLFEGPGRSPQIRDRLERVAERKGSGFLYRWLQRRDPEAAAQVEPADRIRIVRALEVILLSGRRFSEIRKERSPWEEFEVVKVGVALPRPILYGRIDRRVERMFEEGLLEEVRILLERGISPSAKGFEALGYRYAVDVLKGGLEIPEAVELAQRDTRRYAKRQMTWFRKETGVHWVEGPGERPEALDEVLQYLCERE